MLMRYLKQYLWVVLALLMAAVALSVPWGWFALRDAASLNRTHGEALSPLMVTELDHSYERDVNERMRAYNLAQNTDGLLCSSKEIDPGNASLWENISQAQDNQMMDALRSMRCVLIWGDTGMDAFIESCTQNVIMRQSDGQILLVVNNIRLVKDDGRHMELLLDAVDGTIYYLESEEIHSVHRMWDWSEDIVWDWWWLLNQAYQADDAKWANVTVDEETTKEMYIDWEKHIAQAEKYNELNTLETDGWSEEEKTAMRWLRIYSEDWPCIWTRCTWNKDTYCCMLGFGELSNGWTMEIEEQEDEFHYRIQLGMYHVVNAIPELAQRVSLTEYDQIYQEE
ncbi:MAG: hypothetical protein NC543_15170 [bacterium]|nr:hypothetical protein [bacterium]MCM1376633.1 hypothetical protein [Muribaculum sp.]